MRFSIRSLLLVFPAYLLAIAGQDWFECGGPIVLVNDRFRQATIEASQFASQIPYTIAIIEALEENEQAGNETTVEACFALATPLPNPLPPSPRPAVDPWGNPYFCVLKDGPTDPSWPKIGVYSFGRDGKSGSRGMDPDDLNSWDDNSGQLYVKELNKKGRILQALFALFLTPFVYLGLVACGWLFRLLLVIRSAYRRPTSFDVQEAAHEKTPGGWLGVFEIRE